MNKKKPVKKRGRPVKHEVTISNIDSNGWIPLPANINKDTEIECLATICSIIDNWSPEQRKRNLEYICGKYYDFS